MNVEWILEKLDCALREEGMFFFLESNYFQMLEAYGGRTLSFGAINLSLKDWPDNPLRRRLLKIQQGKEGLFAPHLTNPEIWKNIQAHLGLYSALRKPHGRNRFVLLSDGHTAEVSVTHADIWIDRPGKYLDGLWAHGELVVVKKTYFSEAAQKIRRCVEDYLRKKGSVVALSTAKKFKLI